MDKQVSGLGAKILRACSRAIFRLHDTNPHEGVVMPVLIPDLEPEHDEENVLLLNNAPVAAQEVRYTAAPPTHSPRFTAAR